MKERPILFSGPMVRALHDGRKTQTRRIVKPSRTWPIGFIGGQGDQDDPSCYGFEDLNSGQWWTLAPSHFSDAQQIPCPYGAVGERLWVRESLAPTRDAQGYIADWHYAADSAKVPRMPGLNPDFNDAMAFAHLARPSAVPSIHMPRRACRIVLQVTSARVERLNDITDADAIEEGIDRTNTIIPGYARERFISLWTSINGADSWAANPWVWVVEFTPHARM